MRPDALRADDGKSALRIELSNYLRDSGSALSMAEAAALAVRGWIAADRAAAQCRTRADAAAGVRMADRCEPARGYLWMESKGDNHGTGGAKTSTWTTALSTESSAFPIDEVPPHIVPACARMM